MITRMRRAMGHWFEYRRTVNQLSGLSDRQLGDIGVFRDNIQYIARERTRRSHG